MNHINVAAAYSRLGRRCKVGSASPQQAAVQQVMQLLAFNQIIILGILYMRK
jgi:hypothetical protein